MKNPSTLKADFNAARKFAADYYRELPRHITAIYDGKPPITKTFQQDDDDRLQEFIQQHNEDGANIYFAVNEIAESAWNKKAKKVDITGVTALHCDLDDLSEQALARLTGFDPKPSIISCSGGGYQAFWLLDSAQELHLDVSEAGNINKAIADQVGGDDCFNIDRIMRVPHTINYPNKKKRDADRVEALAYVIEEHTNFLRIYKPTDFDHLSTIAILPRSSRSVTPKSIVKRTLNDLGISESDELGVLIKLGDDPVNSRKSNKPQYPSRSEAVFAVVCHLARSGCSPEEIAGILLNEQYGLSESILEKPNPTEYAYRQAEKALATVATDWPDITKFGNPKMSYKNALYGLIKMGVTFENDAFHNRKRIGGHQLQSFQGDLSDDACAMLRKAFVDEFEFDPGKGNILDAVQVLCLVNTFHPVREYLNSLAWDSVDRLETFLIDYFGAEDTELNRAIGKMMLIAAVRRVRQPSVKFDTMIVLEGPQGSGKSTALTILAGDANFSDQNLFALDAKSQMEALEGVWIYEVAELSGLRHTDITLIKSFITRTEDRGRPAYARFKESWPRQCILVGTTNDDKYLKDETGNRRFLPVKTGQIDLENLKIDRDMLWAEAAELEADGASIMLPPDLWKAAGELQASRMQDDPWLDILADAKGVVKDGVERISTEMIYGDELLSIPPAQRHSYHPKRIAINMRALGWEGPLKMRVKGNPCRGYQRETTKIDDQEF